MNTALKKITVYLFVILFVFHPAYGFFIHGSVWEKNWNNQKSYLVFLGDKHVQHPQEFDQLYDVIGRLDTNHTMIVEDSFGAMKQSFFERMRLLVLERSYKIEDKYTLLPRISILCAKYEIPCINVEFREFSNYVHQVIEELKKGTCTQTCQQFAQKLKCYINSTKNHLNKIEAYNDVSLQKINTIITEQIQESLDYVQKISDTLEAMADEIISLALFSDNADTEIAAEKMWVSHHLPESLLLDMEILHHIVTVEDDTIFVCAGANHIKRISPYMAMLGYTLIKQDTDERGIDVRNLLASHFPILRGIMVDPPYDVITVPPNRILGAIFPVATVAAITVALAWWLNWRSAQQRIAISRSVLHQY